VIGEDLSRMGRNLRVAPGGAAALRTAADVPESTNPARDPVDAWADTPEAQAAAAAAKRATRRAEKKEETMSMMVGAEGRIVGV